MTLRIPHRADRRRAGQAMIFIVLAVVILTFVVLWNYDLHKTVRVKMLSQNAGDAAAMMGARWQGITLNLVGDLNIMQALALASGDDATIASISNLQARLAFVGPMIGFMAAQQAAKNNGIYPYADFDALLAEHARMVREDYADPVGPNGEPAIPEPFPGAWSEYADMLDLIVMDGVAAAPDNAHFYSDYVGPHILLDPAFYRAIAGRNWCWFFHQAPDLLESYTDYTWWPPLPPVDPAAPVNSEIFGVGLRRVAASTATLAPPTLLANLANERGLPVGTLGRGTNVMATWYGYGDTWTAWLALDPDAEDPFPASGEVRPQYDYAGADAAVRVIAEATRVTPGTSGGATNTITWTAAAKPFGYLEGEQPPHTFGVVLPAYRDVRLIALDASSATAGGSFDPEWRRFITEDLPNYVATGDLSCSSFYCNQLRTWEDAGFRQDGVDWLQANSAQCTAPGGGGGGPGGGSSRGH